MYVYAQKEQQLVFFNEAVTRKLFHKHCFRRIKKWIYEKQQKSGQTGRRQRYKSLGELEGSRSNLDPGVNGNSGAKSKKHSFSTALQVKLCMFVILSRIDSKNNSEYFVIFSLNWTSKNVHSQRINQ